jgi:hypothetical protein
MVMPKIINCQTNIAIRGRMAAELAVLAQDNSWTKVSLDLLTKMVPTVKLSASGQTIGLCRKGHSAVFAVPIVHDPNSCQTTGAGTSPLQSRTRRRIRHTCSCSKGSRP